MMHFRIPVLAAILVILFCSGCGEGEPPRGATAMKGACEGVLDGTLVDEAEKSDDFNRIYDATASDESYAMAAKTILNEEHVAYVCRLAVEDASESGDDALWIRFTPGLGRLFPEEEGRSYGYLKAYKLGSGMQATIESRNTDVFFPCVRKDRDSPLFVTGTFFNDLDLSTKTRFRELFRSATKMANLLKCENMIKFPSPDVMKPLPDVD